jgi:glycosyltransferase involved in cell wall biosynthesis
VSPGRRRLRLACYGWVDEQAGSLASANHLVLAELLRRGVDVDFYANRHHVPPPRGLGGTGFRYLGVDPPGALGALPPAGQRIVNWGLAPLVRRGWRRRYGALVAREHERRPYDAVLSLSTPPAFTVPGVPTVAWLQGPLQTELEAIRRLRRQIVRTSGRAFYAALTTYYRSDLVLSRSVLRDCDRVVCGSSWAEAQIARWGYPRRRISALPYPVDLDAFRPAEGGQAEGPPTLLFLGRLDPRKRLDLLLEAFALVLDDLPDARLRIVGRPGYAPRQLSVLDGFARSDRVTYSPAVPRQEVVPLLQQASALVQPSENENFGSAVAESLACGTPVVVGPTNGTADYVDGHSRVFPDYTPEAVSAAVVDTIDAVRARPEEVAASARSAAERWFSTSSVVDGLLDVVDRAVSDRREERSRSPR